MSSLPSGILGQDSFLRGMLWDIGDMVAPHDAVRYVDNMLPSPRGALTRRDGRTRLFANLDEGVDSAAAEYEQILDTHQYRKSDGTTYYLYVGQSASTTEFGWIDNTGGPPVNGFTPLETGLEDDSRTIFTPFNDRVALNNGTDDTIVYLHDGTGHESRDMGVGLGVVPTHTLAAGSLTGTYDYVVTVEYGADGESNPPATDLEATPSSQQVELSWSAPTPPAGMVISGYRIWRRKTAGATAPWDTFYLVDAVGSATTSYDDDIVDATVQVDGREIHTNHTGPPEGLIGMAYWQYDTRMVGWGDENYPNRIWMANQGQPEVWQTADETYNPDGVRAVQFFDVPQDDPSNAIIAIVPDGRRLLVFNRWGVRYLLATGDTTVPYVSGEIANSDRHGIISPQAVARDESGEIYYVTNTGIRVIRGNLSAEVSPGNIDNTLAVTQRPYSQNLQRSINTIVTNVPAALRKHVSCAFFNGLLHIALAVANENDVAPTKNNDILIYDPDGHGFYTRRNAYVNGFALANDETAGYHLLTASSAGGMVFTEYVATTSRDDPATGDYDEMVTQEIRGIIEGYDRVVAAYAAAQLESMQLDAAVSDTSVTDATVQVRVRLDGLGRKVFNYRYVGALKTLWSDDETIPSFAGNVGKWWGPGLDGTEYLWSNEQGQRSRPQIQYFYGERAQIVGVEIESTAKFTVHGWAMTYYQLSRKAAG